MNTFPIIDPEFRSLIPPLSPNEREQLEHNILLSHKCYDAIILWEGIILDGHNRFEICEKHGIEFEIIDLQLESREEAKVWIIENQLARRNLNEAMRIEMVLLKEDMLREKAKENMSRGWGDQTKGKAASTKVSKPDYKRVDVQKTLASDADVSIGTFSRYTQLKEHAPPELLDQVKSGQLKIGTAHRILETNKQLRKANKWYEYILDSMPAEGYKEKDPEIHEKLLGLSSLLDGLINKLAPREEHPRPWQTDANLTSAIAGSDLSMVEGGAQ